jgi:hypothetical protein
MDLVNSVEGIVWEADTATFSFSFVSEQSERIPGYLVEQWIRANVLWQTGSVAPFRPRKLDRSLYLTPASTKKR